MQVRVPNFDGKIGHFTFSQRYTFPADFATGNHVEEMTKISCYVKSVEIPGVNEASLSCIFTEGNTVIFHGSVEASFHEILV